MYNPNSNLDSNINELGSRSSNLELPRLYPGLNLASGPQNLNYLPQVDEDANPENPQLPVSQYQNSHYCTWDKIWRNKAVNLPILFILCLSIVDLVPICGGGFYFFKNLGPSGDMRFEMTNLLQYMAADLKADPIMEVQIMNEGSTCPSGFQILNLGTWPGTVAGCLCEDGQLWTIPCEDVNSPKCKKDLPRSSPIEMYEWDDSIWCVKKAILGKDYLRKAECPSGYKECYAGGCFAKDCPITKLEITSTGEATNKFNNNKENRYLTLTRKQGELPLINLQMTFGDIPCFIQDLFAQTIKNSTYGLSTIKDKNCDKYGLDKMFSTRLASQSAHDLYTQNSFPYPVTHLPYFENYANTTTSILSSKVRMKTAKHDYCQDIDEEPINDYLEADVTSSVISFVCVIVLLVPRILNVCEILYRRTKSWIPEFFDKTPELMQMLYQVNFWSSIAVIAILLSFKFVYPVFQAAKGYFEGYEALGCFNGGQGSMIINDYLERLRSIGSSFWIHWVLFVSNVLSGLVCFWLYIVKNKLPQYNLTL